MDQDEIWEDIASAGGIEEAMENAYLELNDLPVVAYVEVSSPLKLAAFMAALRTMLEDTSPNLLQWDTLSHGDYRYVRLTGDETLDEISIYYATLPMALLFGLNEDTLLRAIDRLTASKDPAAAEEEPGADAPEPWLGKSLAVSMDRAGIQAFQLLFDEDQAEETRIQSWASLPILNEWKRHFPDRDPVAVHEALWGERLVCPAGGTYVWNEEWRTMESTVCGHPGRPGEKIGWPAVLAPIRGARAGLTFELGGLRAVLELKRDS